MPVDSPSTETVVPFGRSSRSRAIVRLPLLALLVALIAIVTAGCLPPLLDPPTSGLNYGKGPLDAIRDAADRTTSSGPYANCGLSSTDLAAMMMVPTYFEAGGTVPAPMALSRWDNVSTWSLNANLFAFGQTSGPYVNAFFSPGIGLWQFDSAGGWDLTAADAIDTVTAANAAASTMAYRWCNTPESKLASPQLHRQYSWGPWFGCSTGSSTMCEDRFQQLVTNGSLNTAQDASVDRFGGMQQRTCNIAGIGNGVTCWYVNPANSQGSGGWKSGTYDPARPNYVTPLPKPFYVVRANGREYRMWIKADTGYDIGITASHPVTSNARTSIVWDRTASLCDTTVNRGECGAVSPVGVVDWVSPGTNSINISGWAFDRDTNAPLPIHVYVGSIGNAITTGLSRPDIPAAFPGAAPNAGFSATISSPIGPQRVCAYAIDVGGGQGNVLLGCRDVTVIGRPAGVIDGVSAKPGSIDVWGWSLQPGEPTSVAIVSVDGEVKARVARTVSRPDVQSIFGSELATGFVTSVPASAGRHTVCLTTGTFPTDTLGCRTVDLPGGSPFGAFDWASPRPGSVALSGWAIDPDVAAPDVIHVYVNNVGYALTADQWRGDLAAAFPSYGGAHGFSAQLPAPGGRVTVCVYGINIGVGANSSLGCRIVDVPTGSPVGVVDSIVRNGSTVSGSGWVFDPDTAESTVTHVYVNGVGYAVTANGNRPDIASIFPGYGPAHGFSFNLPATGSSTVCVYGINVGGGGNVLLGCRTV